MGIKFVGMMNYQLSDKNELSRNPCSHKNWIQYIQKNGKNHLPIKKVLYEQALKIFPASYKLWFAYLREKRDESVRFRPDHPEIEVVSDTFQRSIVTMNKMPRIWLEFMQ